MHRQFQYNRVSIIHIKLPTSTSITVRDPNAVEGGADGRSASQLIIAYFHI